MYKKLIKLLIQPLKILDNPITSGIIKIFLVVYAGAILPKMPNYIIKILQNPVMKLLVLFLISYVGMKDPVISLLIGIGFTLSMLTLNKIETISDVHDILDVVIDVPQEALNDLIDGAQDIVKTGANVVDKVTGLKVAEPVTKIANQVIDGVQGISNDIIDGSQELVKNIVGTIIPKEEKKVEEEKVEEIKEEFSMKSPDNKDFIMGSLGDIKGMDVEPKTEGIF